jgi:hypothetical protein
LNSSDHTSVQPGIEPPAPVPLLDAEAELDAVLPLAPPAPEDEEVAPLLLEATVVVVVELEPPPPDEDQSVEECVLFEPEPQPAKTSGRKAIRRRVVLRMSASYSPGHRRSTLDR